MITAILIGSKKNKELIFTQMDKVQMYPKLKPSDSKYYILLSNSYYILLTWGRNKFLPEVKAGFRGCVSRKTLELDGTFISQF